MTTASKLRSLLSEPEVLVCPGVFDGISARAALHQNKFKALYMTGAGTVASRLGLPDVGLAGLSEMSANASMIANINPTIPLIADADTGYGNSAMCARTLTLYALAGVAALHVEDQVHSKRCGHLLGKQIVPKDEFVGRITAMAIQRKKLGSDIIIIARTDSLQSSGVDEAISRMKAAVEVGADMAFVEGIESREQAEKVVKDLAPTPVLVNMVPGGVTPNWSVEEIQQIGFKMAIYPGVAFAAAFKSIVNSFDALTDSGLDPGFSNGGSPKELFMALGLGEIIGLDKAVGGATFASV